MILSCVFLFLVLAAASAFIYYLYAFFIPALKLKNRDYNESLVSNFTFDDKSVSECDTSLLSQKEKAMRPFFDSLYRSKVNDEKICVEFPAVADSDEKALFFPDENFILFDADGNYKGNKTIDVAGGNAFLSGEKSGEKAKCFKFWICCYKLLHRKEFKPENVL